MTWFEWVSLVGSALSILAFFGFSVNLLMMCRQRVVGTMLNELWLLMRQPWNVAMLFVALFSTMWLSLESARMFPANLIEVTPLLSMALVLAMAIILRDEDATKKLTLREIRRLTKTQNSTNSRCVVVRFDVDRLKAIARYSFHAADGVREVVRNVLMEEIHRLRRAGTKVSVIPVYGEDESIVILAGVSEDEAADFADSVRDRVRALITAVPFYSEVAQIIREGLHHPTEPSRGLDAIGTVSAGLAACRGSGEAAFVDASAAVKEAKVHGRDKTVILRPSGPAEVRGPSQHVDKSELER